MNLQIAFRTDASLDIGTGHVMRCLTLADALRERGAVMSMIAGACHVRPEGAAALSTEMDYDDELSRERHARRASTCTTERLKPPVNSA